MLPEIKDFLDEHPEFGPPVGTQEIPDWARGKRQRVTFEKTGQRRSLLFYTAVGSVMTVYEDGPNGRVVVWGEGYKGEGQRISELREASGSLPEYVILATVNLMAGGKAADVLTPSLSRQTPVQERERILRDIATKDGFRIAQMVSTPEAAQANNSASFAKQHPDALRTGFLGFLEDGVFRAGEDLFE